MFTQLLIGSIIIVLTIIMTAAFIEAAIMGLNKFGNRVLGQGTFVRKVTVLAGVTTWLLAAISAAIWVWAIAFYILGVFEGIEPSLYFSMVSFTTLGFGDVLLPDTWRLLAGMLAANGLILFGLMTAFLIEVLTSMRDGDLRTYK